MDGWLLLDPSLTSGFEERLFVDHEEGVRSVAPSFANDWSGCNSSVDGDEDEDVMMVGRAVEERLGHTTT